MGKTQQGVSTEKDGRREDNLQQNIMHKMYLRGENGTKKGRELG